MTNPTSYVIHAHRVDAQESRVNCKHAKLVLDTALQGRGDLFNPAELFLASIAGCMLKGVERVAPMLGFTYRGVDIEVHAVRQDKPPRMARVDYEVRIDTDESDHRIELLHENIRKFGTISNTVAAACPLEGRMVRQALTAIA